MDVFVCQGCIRKSERTKNYSSAWTLQRRRIKKGFGFVASDRATRSTVLRRRPGCQSSTIACRQSPNQSPQLPGRVLGAHGSRLLGSASVDRTASRPRAIEISSAVMPGPVSRLGRATGNWSRPGLLMKLNDATMILRRPTLPTGSISATLTRGPERCVNGEVAPIPVNQTTRSTASFSCRACGGRWVREYNRDPQHCRASGRRMCQGGQFGGSRGPNVLRSKLERPRPGRRHLSRWAIVIGCLRWSIWSVARST
jgi:hypothetical protein